MPVASAVKTSPIASGRPVAPPPPVSAVPPTPAVSHAPAPAPSMSAPVAATVPGPSLAPEPSFARGGANKNKLVLAGAGVAAVAIAAFALLGGSKTGKLVVTVAGPGGKAIDQVEVLIDNEKVCSTSPCIVPEIAAGTRVLQVKAPGFETKAGRALQIEAGKEYAENIELAPESSGAGLKVSAQGSGLELYINGKYVGPLPQEVKDLEPGKHTVKIAGSSTYAPFEQEVSIEANKVLELEPKLKLLKGKVTIQLGENADGAEIYFVDGSSKKQITKKTFPLAIEVPADKEYTVLAERKGYETYERRVSFDNGDAEQTVTVELSSSRSGSSTAAAAATRTPTSSGTSTSTAAAPKPAASSGQATLNINSIPVSNVILDGKPLGSTPKVGVSVSPGSHTVVFVHPEHGRKVRAVTVQAGQTATAAVRFP